MEDPSPLKRFWNAIKLPPAVPRREAEREPGRAPSAFARFWNAIKPPPAIKHEGHGLPREEQRRRRRVVLIAVGAVVAIAAAGGVYQYVASGQTRADKMYQEGMRLMGSGDYEAAVARFTEAIRIWPSLAAAYLERGLAHKSMNQVDVAIQDFQSAIGQDPNLAEAHSALGTIYRERGDLTRAMNELNLAIQAGGSTDAFYQRGQVHESLGQHKEAVQDYDAAIHEQPDAPYVYRARAMARDAMGDRAAASADRRQAFYIERH
jgi:tetratricopeptide (TPR) repeat protein